VCWGSVGSRRAARPISAWSNHRATDRPEDLPPPLRDVPSAFLRVPVPVPSSDGICRGGAPSREPCGVGWSSTSKLPASPAQVAAAQGRRAAFREGGQEGALPPRGRRRVARGATRAVDVGLRAAAGQEWSGSDSLERAPFDGIQKLVHRTHSSRSRFPKKIREAGERRYSIVSFPRSAVRPNDRNSSGMVPRPLPSASLLLAWRRMRSAVALS
jgi:hypothetical protein